MILRRAIILLCLPFIVSELPAENVEFLKNESRRYSAQIDSASSTLAKKTAAKQSLDFARQAVATAPKDAGAHVTLAIALGKMTDFTDNRTKMLYARDIRDEAETALRLDPRNDLACLILGKWNDEMSRLNPLLRAIAIALYGKMPDASAADAEKYFREATVLDPSQIRHHAEFALFLTRKNRDEEAREEWQKLLPLSPQDAEDRDFIAQAKTALKN